MWQITGMLLELNDEELFALLMPDDVQAGAAGILYAVAESNKVLVQLVIPETAPRPRAARPALEPLPWTYDVLLEFESLIAC